MASRSRAGLRALTPLLNPRLSPADAHPHSPLTALRSHTPPTAILSHTPLLSLRSISHWASPSLPRPTSPASAQDSPEPSSSATDSRGSGTSSREQQDNSPYVSQPWTYTMTEIPPDTTAARLADKSKEDMFSLHKQNPEFWTAARLAKEYRIREQRAHAILWLKELEKQQEAKLGRPLDDSVLKQVEAFFGTVPKAAREQHVTIFPSEEVDAIEEGEERTKKLLEESAREEMHMVEEFVRRMNFNKLQMSGAVKVNPIDRRRPNEGWSYMVEELGEEGRRGKAGGRRYVLGPDGSKRGLNDFEKQFLEREKSRPRRRIVP